MLMTLHCVPVYQTLILFRKTTKIFCPWFHNNHLISNAEKSYLIVSSKENLEIQVSSCSIRNKNSVKLFGIHILSKYHLSQLCKKASNKLHALARIAKYMDINKQRMLMKAFLSSHFLTALKHGCSIVER